MTRISLADRFLENRYHSTFEHFIEKKTPYKTVKILGMGSYGIAYLLKHKETSEMVVLKRLRRKHKNKPKNRRLFETEIDILNSISLPNIPNILTTGELDHIPFYIMDYISGSTFEHFIFEQNKKFSVSEALDTVRQLLEIVIAIHRQGVVHRDLRIPNILMNDHNLYVIDFGLATFINEEALNVELENPKKAEDHRSDLYFSGHFLLYLLYSNYSPVSKKEKSWQEELQLPTEVQHFIERLLLIQPAFSSAQEAYDTLLDLQDKSAAEKR